MLVLPIKCISILCLLVFSDTSVDLSFEEKSVHVSLIPNPSHLEVSLKI